LQVFTCNFKADENLDPGDPFVKLICRGFVHYGSEFFKRGTPMKLLTILGVMFLICFFTSTSSADIYSWTDKSGVRHFTNYSPPPIAKLIIKDVPVSRGTVPEKETVAEGTQMRADLEEDEIRAKRKRVEASEEAPYSSESAYPNVNYTDESKNGYVSGYPLGFHRYPPELRLLRHLPNYHFKYHLDKPLTKKRLSAFRLKRHANKPTIWDRKALLRQKSRTGLGRNRVFGWQVPKARGRPSAHYFAYGGGHYRGTSIPAKGRFEGRASAFGGKGRFGGRGSGFGGKGRFGGGRGGR
jgi:hypothetical protein